MLEDVVNRQDDSFRSTGMAQTKVTSVTDISKPGVCFLTCIYFEYSKKIFDTTFLDPYLKLFELFENLLFDHKI